MSAARPSIDQSWQTLLERYDIPARIARDGSFLISADTINQVREARLMAKFDEARSLPQCLKTYGIQILPLSRGLYILGPYDTYAPLDYPRLHPQPISVPRLDTLAATDIHSEAEALHFLSNSGVWPAVFGAPTVHATISGRRASGQFGYSIRRTDGQRQSLQVDNAQIEIDAGYETSDAVYVCEAKNRHVTELHVRQLYYPFRFVGQRTRKTVIPVSVIFSNQTFYITRYRFADTSDYNSLTIDARFCYTLDPQPLAVQTLAAVYAETPAPQPAVYTRIPFPQADNFQLLWRLCEALGQRPHTTHDVTQFIGYAPRQSDYYVNAGRSLGLIERAADAGVTVYRLSAAGEQIMRAPLHEQKARLITAMMAIPCFYELFPVVLRERRTPRSDEIVAVMEAHPWLSQHTAVTIRRRASTVAHWLAWAVEQLTMNNEQ